MYQLIKDMRLLLSMLEQATEDKDRGMQNRYINAIGQKLNQVTVEVNK